MLIHFATSEHEATLDAAHYPIPAKGSLVQWDLNMHGPNPLQNGRYRVEEVVWYYGLNPKVVIFMTPSA